MSLLRVCDAYHELVVHVGALERPPQGSEWMRAREVVFAVFEDADPAAPPPRFLGLAGWGVVARHPERIFVDQLRPPLPSPLRSDSPLDEAMLRLHREDHPALPVVDPDGAFLGAVTRSSALEAMLGAGAHPPREGTRLESLLQRLKELEEYSARVGELAHDLSNSLLAVTNLAQLMERSVGPEHSDDAQVLARSSLQAAELLRRLQAATPGRHTPAAFDLAERLPAFMAHARTLVPDPVALSLDVRAAGTIHADPTDVERVLQNLVVNAGEAMPDGGAIRIVLDQVDVTPGAGAPRPWLPRGRYARLAVEDTGPGMDEELKARIFDPTFSTREADGLRGVGLTIAARLARRNRGGIHCASAPGQGSRFEVLLPLRAEVRRDAVDAT